MSTCEVNSQSSTPDSSQSSTSVHSQQSYNFDQDTTRTELANMIIMHEYPLSIVDHVGFRRYSSALQPLFKMVSRNSIKNDILKIYDYEKTETMRLVERNQSRVAITTNMWTSSNQKKGFMAITAHFIDDSWLLQSYILRFVYVPCPHTKDVLCDVLVDSLLEWNVDRKLSTVNNCSTNDAMIEILMDKLDSNSLLLKGTLCHMRCCAHILNLIVKDGLDVIREAIEKIRDCVSYWMATPKRVEKFEEAARQLCIPSTKKLELDCATRWNSTYLMLQTALMYKDVFSRLKQRESQSYNRTLPSEEDWVFTKEICGMLKLFYTVSELFSGTKYPTANLYFSKICEIRMALSQWLSCSNEVIRKMASNMVEKYDKFWLVIHGIMGVAAVLDPRYKMTLIEYYFLKLFGRVGGESSLSSSSLKRIDSNDQDALSEYDLFVSRRRATRSVNVKSELDRYLEKDVLPRTPDFDILAWWKSNGFKYPTLQAIARDVLAIPVSTVASESDFSTSGRLVSSHRSRLHPNTMEALMCAQSWLRAVEMEGDSTVESHNYATIYDDMDLNESCIDMVNDKCAKCAKYMSATCST